MRRLKLMRFRCDMRLDRRCTDQHRTAGMVLDPLAEVGIGMLVPILIRCSKHVVDLKRSRKGCQHDEDERHDQGDRGRGTWASDGGGRTWDHRRRAYSKTLFRCQSCHRILGLWLLLLKQNSSMLGSAAKKLAFSRVARVDRHPYASGRCPL